MKTKLLYITIFSLLFIIQACKRDNPCEGKSDKVYTYNIPDSNKDKIPYTGTETLVFISNTGDTAILVGQGKDTYYETESKGISFGDCPRTGVYKYENILYDFNGGNKYLSKLSFSLFKYDEYDNNSSVNFIINNNKLVLTNMEYLSSIKTAQDSIKLNGIITKGIYMGYQNKSVVFSFKYGILKFEDFNGRIWILNK